MTRKSLLLSLAAMILTAGLSANADTFKNKQTGEVFYGFRTLKTTVDKTLVYNENEKKLLPIKLLDYEVTMDNNGRRNSVVLVSITDAEALLSESVTKAICNAIIKGANSGPRFVLVKIDCPGGRGEYMKEICSTISKIDICPVVAYISGGPFGGAHSAAAAIALACDKIYIAPNASMSALGPFVSTSTGHSEVDFLKTYSPDTLASYSVYAATLAENNQRPGILSKALLDKRIGLVEVVDTSGVQSIVQKDLMLADQTVVKTICEGLASSATATTESASTTGTEPGVAETHSRVLQLPPNEAIRFKMADAITDSIQSLLADMNSSDAQVASSQEISKTSKQFVAAKRNIGLSLSRISFFENRTATLEEQLKIIEEQERTTPVRRSRTVNEVGGFTRGRVTIPSSDYYYYYDQPMTMEQTGMDNQQITPNNTMVTPNQNTGPYRTTPRSRFNRVQGSETVVSNEPAVASADVTRELSFVLNNLIGEYRTAIALSKRWVGALPPEITIQALQRNLESAIALSDNLRFRTQ